MKTAKGTETPASIVIFKFDPRHQRLIFLAHYWFNIEWTLKPIVEWQTFKTSCTVIQLISFLYSLPELKYKIYLLNGIIIMSADYKPILVNSFC